MCEELKTEVLLSLPLASNVPTVHETDGAESLSCTVETLKHRQETQLN